jgi:hypothetical protein
LGIFFVNQGKPQKFYSIILVVFNFLDIFFKKNQKNFEPLDKLLFFHKNTVIENCELTSGKELKLSPLKLFLIPTEIKEENSQTINIKFN